MTLDDITRNRHGGNPESEAANKKIHRSKAAVRNLIYAFFVDRGEFGATADEAVAYFNSNHNHIAPRISELRRDKRLVPTDRRRKTHAGSMARVLIAVVAVPTKKVEQTVLFGPR